MRTYGLKGSLMRYGLVLLLFCSCVKEARFDPSDPCVTDPLINTSISELKGLYQGQTMKILDDLILEAYVISSDKAGNFFGSLFVQDHPHNPNDGLELLVDLRQTHLFYPPGQKIIIRLRGLHLGESNGNFQLGATYRLFGKQWVGRIPGYQVKNHLALTCGGKPGVLPKKIDLEGIAGEKSGTLVILDSLQFTSEMLGLSYADAEEGGNRLLEDCAGNTIVLETSGYSDFSDEFLPEGNGPIRAVLVQARGKTKLLPRGPEDIQMTGDRCNEGPEPRSTDRVFISEIADPDNNSQARFIELYNAGELALDMIGWTLERYTNDNFEMGSSIDLTGILIAPGEAITLSANAEVFKEIYGFNSTREGGSNSAAASNGDDNLVLRDPFGNIIDIFGRIGEDGTNTDHEFEDGRALRLPGVVLGSPLFIPEQWVLYNDTGDAGTIQQPQIAPEDYTPGQH